jgi:hypothetical protein
MRHVSRSSGLLHLEASWDRFSKPQDWQRRNVDGARGIIVEVAWR